MGTCSGGGATALAIGRGVWMHGGTGVGCHRRACCVGGLARRVGGVGEGVAGADPSPLLNLIFFGTRGTRCKNIVTLVRQNATCTCHFSLCRDRVPRRNGHIDGA